MDIQISELINTAEPHNVLNEVRHIIYMAFQEFDFEPIYNIFQDVVRIFQGKYPGYRECTTEYHNLKHTTDTILAMIRLIHGAVLSGESLSQWNVTLGLISVLFHDIGYIQTSNDIWGTGAKYTLVHIQRGIEFMDHYFKEHGLTRDDFFTCRDIVSCTDINVNMSHIQFKSEEIKLLGQMIGTADILGEVADRAYLEKLLFLFYEFREGKFGFYSDELDLLKKTPRFYDVAQKRLQEELGGVNRYMLLHFKERWDIDKDLYQEYIEKNKSYLNNILKYHEKEYRNYLRRGGVVKKLDDKSP
ncbi:MAG: hypothetical protein ACMUJM_16345 [bacterium]